jgi:hypothetical protein
VLDVRTVSGSGQFRADGGEVQRTAQDAQVKDGSMTRGELERAIRAPAEKISDSSVPKVRLAGSRHRRDQFEPAPIWENQQEPGQRYGDEREARDARMGLREEPPLGGSYATV